jgi:hypothetical protein
MPSRSMTLRDCSLIADVNETISSSDRSSKANWTAARPPSVA